MIGTTESDLGRKWKRTQHQENNTHTEANQKKPTQHRLPGRRRDGFVGGVPRDGRKPGGPHQPHRAEVPQDRDPPQAVKAGGCPEDGARGLSPQDPGRAMQVGELDRGAPRHDGDQGHRRHVQLTGS